MIAAALGFLRRRVAGRMFLLFILSAFLPLAVIAALSLSEVRTLLLEQGEQRLAATAKAYGMTLFERLLVAVDVAATEANRAAVGSPLDSLARRTFGRLALLAEDGRVRPLLGHPPVPAIGEEARARLADGKPVIEVVQGGTRPRLLLLVPVPSHHAIAVGEPKDEFLWGAPDEHPTATDFCIVQDGTRAVLHCTSEPDPGMWATVRAGTRSSLATARWERDGQALRGVAWPQFMGAGFGTADWVVIASQPESYQLLRATQFRRIYLPVVALALLLVTWLTLRQAGHIVRPLARLAERARGIARNDFGTPLALRREDELGELGDAFDQMAERLGRQIGSLHAFAEIDRLILSTLDTSQVIRSVLRRLGEVTAADDIAITLFDRDDPDQARTYFLIPDGSESLDMRRHVSAAAERAALGESTGTLAAVSPDLRGPYFGSPDAAPPARAYVQPIVWRGTACGAIALGYPEARSPGEEQRDQVRDLADRVAVAVASAWRDEELYVQAHYDGLTALPNRLLFKDRMGQEIARSGREGLRFAVLFIDLDGFKNVNDSFGHTAGDAVLREAARRITRCVRTSDTVARLGGDEFTALLANLHHVQEAWIIAESIVEALSREYDANGRSCFLSASLGIATYPEDGASVEELLKKADTAMYRAKAAGRSQAVFFEERMNAEAVARLTLDRDLRLAIERGELELHYQPQVDLRTDTIVAAEALVRWRHPQLGLVSPVRFIPLAEESGFIEQVGHWTLRQACAQMKAWRSAGLPIERLSVNVSPRQFRRRGLVEHIRRCVEEAGLPPQCIEIEITEGLLMERGDSVVRLLEQLHVMGHRIALDDFGTGFSSMAYLKRFPVHTIKIDRVFVEGLSQDADSGAIVEAIVAMSHALGKTVIAEGVETAQQREHLREAGCDQIQGFLVSRALPPPAFEALLLEQAQPAALA